MASWNRSIPRLGRGSIQKRAGNVVEGRYPLDGLWYGFEVRHKSPDGKERPFGASDSQAQKVLLMNLKTAPAK